MKRFACLMLSVLLLLSALLCLPACSGKNKLPADCYPDNYSPEEIVRAHVTVERGRIYNPAWYE